MEKIIFKEEILEYFDNLVYRLFEDGYFGFQESARDYVDKIVGFVLLSITSFPHKKTPKMLDHLGLHYIFYKSNSRTTWYIFFEKRNQNYLITGILNNHSEEANAL